MTIPNFKNKEDCDVFLKMFEDRLAVKVAMLNRVKDDMFPGTSWNGLTSGHMEVMNDITQSLLYDVEYTFKEQYPEYKNDDDEIFIPRRSFKQDVEEALLNANQKFWNNANECPPCDTLQCVDHLTDD